MTGAGTTAGSKERSLRIVGALLWRDGAWRDEDLCVSDGRFVASPAAGGPVLDLRGHAIVPAWINAHEHLHRNAHEAWRPDRVFADAGEWVAWLGTRREELPEVETLSKEARHWHGALKNLLCGATAVVHHDRRDAVHDDPDFPVRVLHVDWCHSPEFAGQTGPTLADGLALRRAGRPWVVHLGEGTSPRARAEFSLLREAGGVAAGAILVHAVGASAEELRELAAAGGGVVWCPSSNLALLGATLDRERLTAAGDFALGTDSRLSGARDLAAEFGVALGLGSIPAHELFERTTRDAARLFGADGLGSLEPGGHADFLVLRGGDDPIAALGSAGRADLRAVVRAGRPRVADPDLAHWLEIAGVTGTPVRLDGRPKVLDETSLGPPGALEAEPGLERSGSLPPAQAYPIWAPVYERENPVTRLDCEAIERLDAGGPGPLLDVGCGTGRRLPVKARASGAAPRAADPEALVCGVEPSLAMLRAGDSPPGCCAGRVEQLPFGDASFARIWSRLVVGHVSWLAPFYAELARVARPAARLLVTDFHPDAVARGWTRSFSDTAGDRREVAHHCHELEEHRAAARQAGWEVDTVLDLSIGESVRGDFAAAGRLADYEEVAGARLVLALAFTRNGARRAPS